MTGTPTTPTVPTEPPAGDQDSHRITRVSATWVAIAAGLIVMVLLLIFILQNLQRVRVHFLGLSGELPLGMAMLAAAVGAGILVAIAGTSRVVQLRRTRRDVTASDQTHPEAR